MTRDEGTKLFERPGKIPRRLLEQTAESLRVKLPTVEPSDFVVKMFTHGKAADLSVLIWWLLWDIEDYPFNTGLVTNANERKEAFDAYQVTVDQLIMAEYERTWSPAEIGHDFAEVHQFTRNGNGFYVGWINPARTEETHLIRVPGATATLTDAYGATQQVRDSDDGQSDGQISILLNENPVFILTR